MDRFINILHGPVLDVADCLDPIDGQIGLIRDQILCVRFSPRRRLDLQKSFSGSSHCQQLLKYLDNLLCEQFFMNFDETCEVPERSGKPSPH
jgi:hypothetical protein